MAGPEHQAFKARVGQRIRTARLEAGLSQEELARMLDTRSNQVSRWERGERWPSYGNIVALAVALELSEEKLICGTEPIPNGGSRSTQAAAAKC